MYGAVELVLTGNGPGELSGWVRPVAHAAREMAREAGKDLALTLALTPSQFAGGREEDVVRRWDLFDRILDAPTSVRLAVGLGRLRPSAPAALIHLGGDLWFSSRLARRLHVRACALVETSLIAGRHAPFARVFAINEAVARELESGRIPKEKIVVTGDPRVDAVLQDRERGTKFDLGDRLVVSFMPSSRDYLFPALVPYFLRIARAVSAQTPDVTFQMIVSPFLSPQVVAGAQAGDASGLPVSWVTGDPWQELGRSDLVLTIPGTNTVELAVAGIPFAVITPADFIDHLRLEGIANWIARLPTLGRALKRRVALRLLARQRFVALPNLHAGREIVPEWIGYLSTEDVAARLTALLEDGPRRATMASALREIYAGSRGASRRIAGYAIALAEQAGEVHS